MSIFKAILLLCHVLFKSRNMLITCKICKLAFEKTTVNSYVVYIISHSSYELQNAGILRKCVTPKCLHRCQI
jgi:hypothetical protein